MLSAWSLPLVASAIFVAGESPTWKGYRRRSAPSGDDARSAAAIKLAMLGFLAGAMVGVYARGREGVAVPDWVARSGLLLAVIGTALRFWSIRTLGRSFTLTIQVPADRQVIDRGPYRWIRHPGYVGADLAILGLGFTFGNWLSPILFTVPMLFAHAYRVRKEEQVLLEKLGDGYRSYKARTGRFVPFVR